MFEAAAQLWPKPLGVAISGEASADESFKLAKIGVHGYLAKPHTLEELAAEVERVRRTPAPPLDPLLSQLVGQYSLHEVQDHMRSVMLHQALALTEGSRSGAARLLDVSRQAVQQILRAESPSEAKEPAPPAHAPVVPPAPPKADGDAEKAEPPPK